jgi:hypothetical protein
LRRRPPLDVPGGYQGSVRLVLIVVASVFFVAAVCKLVAGGPRLGWALSDNLRHQIVTRFDWYGRTRTPIADWLVVRSWRYESFALVNLVSQLSPLGAALAIDRPRLRLAFGLVWIGELVGLGVVMAYWDLHWLPLAAVFVDWDRLVRARATPVAFARAAPRRFALGFLAFYGVQAFVLDQRLNAFPFSSFPMFAEIRAKRPFSRHSSYELVGGHLELIGARPEELEWLAGRGVAYRELWRERRPSAVERRLRALLADLRASFPDSPVTGVRLWLAVDRVPAYPAPARLDRHDLAIVAELAADGRFRTALGYADRSIAISPLELTALIGYGNDLLAPIALPATKIPGGFVIDAPLPDAPRFVVGYQSGARWLIAHRGA